MKKDDKIAKLLKEHGKQRPPSVDFTEMVMMQIQEETIVETDAIHTLISSQKEALSHSPSLSFEAELFEKIAQQNTKAKVRPVFPQKGLIGIAASVFLLSANYTFFMQSFDNQYFDYDIFSRVLQSSTSAFIIATAIIVGGGMYVLDYFLREKLALK